MDKIAHMSQKEFKTLKWLPMKQRFNQYRYFKKQCSHYLNKVFVKSTKRSLSLRNSYHKHKLKSNLKEIGKSSFLETLLISIINNFYYQYYFLLLASLLLLLLTNNINTVIIHVFFWILFLLNPI